VADLTVAALKANRTITVAMTAAGPRTITVAGLLRTSALFGK
jgi:hypothetical protein